MQIFIKHNHTYTLDVEKETTIDEVKEKIQDKLGLTPNSYFMVCSGKLINNGKIGDYHIYKDSTIHINIRLNFTNLKISNNDEF
jgi:hypothetical protein